MAKTTNVLLRRVGKMHPTSVEEYISLGGFNGIKKAVEMGREAVLDEVEAAMLRGRGGAAYPAGKKWKQMSKIKENPKYIVCNGDEGEPGTFKDRELLEKTPLSVIEGMLIAGYVMDSRQGYIYIRGEYRRIQKIFQEAIDHAVEAGYLGDNIMGIEGFNYNISIVSGAGAYVCGENSTLLNSIEGKSGRPRVKPPHLAEVGLFLKPTLVNNVESYANIPIIVEEGGAAWNAYGMPDGGGTKLISISGHAKKRGNYEIGLGRVTLREIIEDEELGGGTASGKAVGFVHLGGQSGAIAFPEQFDTKYGYQELVDAGVTVGSGAVVVMDESVDLVDYIRQVTKFFIHESCGKCNPCRLGGMRILEVLERMCNGTAKEGDVELLEKLARNVQAASACGLGQSMNKALQSALKHRRTLFEAKVK